jgi:hypothetical protein
MCNFISFKFNNGKYRFGPNLSEHAEIPGNGFECEWTDDDEGETLTVRVPPTQSEHVAGNVRATILGEFKRRRQLIDYAIREVAASGGSLYLSGCPIPPSLKRLEETVLALQTYANSAPPGQSERIKSILAQFEAQLKEQSNEELEYAPPQS